VPLRKWFEMAYVYWLMKKWWRLLEEHMFIAILLLPFTTLTFITATGLLVIVDAAVALVKRLITRG
jgi:hypothetical protein